MPLLHRLPVVMTCALIANILSAATETANLTVTANVLDTCSVTTTAMDFGNLNQSASTFESTAGTIVVTCSSAKTVDITLDGGDNDDGSTRRMTDGGGNFIDYSVYSDSGHSSAVAINGSIFNAGVAASTPTTVSVYGQVPSALHNAGVYSDTIVITVTY